jgi:hypothetical protein
LREKVANEGGRMRGLAKLPDLLAPEAPYRTTKVTKHTKAAFGGERIPTAEIAEERRAD